MQVDHIDIQWLSFDIDHILDELHHTTTFVSEFIVFAAKRWIDIDDNE